MISTPSFHLLFLFLLLLCFTILPTKSTHTITASRPLNDDGTTLISSGGTFALGFFSPGASGHRFLAIWYNNIPLLTAVWVANRDAPIHASSAAVLQISGVPPRLALFNGAGDAVWSANSSKKAAVAQLLDSGNLVVMDEDGAVVWESFDYPCDIQLPGMKIGRDLESGFQRFLTSWKTSDDPSPGSYTYKIDPKGYPQPVLMKGSVEQYRNGPWNGLRFSGNPSLKSNSIFTFNFVMNQEEIYYLYNLLNGSLISHRLLSPYGTMQRLVWSDHAQGWVMYLTAQSDTCDTYALCGKFGSCNIAGSPDCGCLRGFEPRLPRHWEAGDWSDGCVRKTPLSCKGDGFLKYTNVKLPDTQYSWYNTSLTLDECRHKCLLNCSCVGYASLDVRDGGSGCLIWIGVLIDVRVYAANGQDLYVRMAASELGKGTKRMWILVGCTLSVVFVVCTCAALYLWKRRKQKPRGKGGGTDENQEELPVFDFNLIARATNNFSDDNKIGEGGFGPVYKGTLKEGQEIAVKRLSKDSRQGPDEFKNEALCIVRLQHRNLVKLLGCCIQADERILIYEYLPKKSLNNFIFDETRSNSLDWPTRFQIIKGIARGLLYLHQDSRLRIIHRDLKAGNILLDDEMNPKISDFGMARILDGNEYEAKTRRVVGTYGYMSPEYAIDGRFSVKSDVFSFGVLVLEIVSGKRNRGFIHPDHCHNLLGHAWRAFEQGGSLKIVDPLLNDTCNASQVLRSIQVGLLCVQQSPEDRPSMSSVTVMLDSECELPRPKEPGFFIARNVVNMDSMSSYLVESTISCSNEVTTTIVSGR